MFFGASAVVQFAVHALGQKGVHLLVGELLFTGRLDNMALGQTVRRFHILVRDFLYVGVAAFAFDFGMYADAEGMLVDE